MSGSSFKSKKRDGASAPKPREVGGFTSGKNVGPHKFDETENFQSGRIEKKAARDMGERLYRDRRA